MKFSGNKKNARYLGGSVSGRNKTAPLSRVAQETDEPKVARAALKKKKARRTKRILTAVLLIAVMISCVLYAVYMLGVKPPPMKIRGGGTQAANGAALPASSDRKGTQYTFVILGFDDGKGNTDTIMVANFDVDNHKLSVVSIPRDTLVNVAWSVKKANTLYSSGGGVDGVTKGLSDILGFQVDFYVLVDLKAFSTLVDAVDGVDFDVPKDMDYDDPAQNLHIHLNKGMQHLDGKTALQLIRCRSVYSTADIGRIETQQAFLKTAAAQILQNQNKLDITELANIFIKGVKTDLDLGEIIWLGREFYKMDAADVTFTTIPADYWDTINGTSYVTIYINDWLKLLNEKINPFKEDIAAGDLSILTRDEKGKLYSTSGVYAGKKSWGSASSDEDSKPVSGTVSSPSPSGTVNSASPSPSAAKTSPDASPSGTGSNASSSPVSSPKTSPSPGEE